ncbi:hypothetical protein EUU23_07135 [Sphingorhabdus sp. IMCC26285]|uniref:Spore coat protein U domain-containing protein n=1 Tax=Sphingorhabdus profundilacus TaxID=2509718 RepID=A0A6I4LVD0_9SPHN|nr:hypothetical protein [Sphingorhabdus profundilacus]MVZ97477.1 hypothetical protein [Sphingorhabdus profundilacus]
MHDGCVFKGGVFVRLSGAKFLALSAIFVASFAFFPAATIAKAPSGSSLQIEIEASIGRRCGIAPLGANSNDSGRIDEPTRIAFRFGLDCNTPFKIGVAAKNGALQLVDTASQIQNVGAFAYRKNYVAGLQFNTDQTGLVTAGECASTSLTSANSACRFYGSKPGSGLYSGRDTSAIGKEGELTVTWQGDEADTVRLAAGAYQEILTIIVAPST